MLYTCKASQCNIILSLRHTANINEMSHARQEAHPFLSCYHPLALLLSSLSTIRVRLRLACLTK